MAAIPLEWPITAMPGTLPDEAQGDLVNAYALKMGDEVQIRRTPGCDLSTPLPDQINRTPRGTHSMTGFLLHAWDDELRIRRQSDGFDYPASAALTGTDPVSIASNLRQTGNQCVIVTDLAAYTVDAPTGALALYPDTDLGAVIDVDYFSGYFVFARSNGELVATGLQDTTIDPLSKAAADYAGDELLRVLSNGSNLLAFGTKSIEVWTDVGSMPFPLARQTALDIGLLAKHAIAGGVRTWGEGVIFAAHDFSVRRLVGLTPTIISNPDVSNDIYAMRDRADELRAQVYSFGDQNIWSLSSPEWTWEHNLASGAWHRRKSFQWPGWRGRFAVSEDARWYVQDGKGKGLLEIKQELFDEVGERMQLMIESKAAKSFPAGIRLPQVAIDAVMALGKRGLPSPFQTNPCAEISWSHDGARWSNPVTRSFGKEGAYGKLMTVNGLGRSTSRGVRVRFVVNDPVQIILRGALAKNASASRPRAVR